MHRTELQRRVAARSGISYEEAGRVLDAAFAELSAAAARHQLLDLGRLGRFEPEARTGCSRFVPDARASAFGAHRRD